MRLYRRGLWNVSSTMSAFLPSGLWATYRFWLYEDACYQHFSFWAGP